MKKLILVLLIGIFAVSAVIASPMGISVSPGMFINMQNSYTKPDLTSATGTKSIYATAKIALDVDIPAGFGASFFMLVPYPVSVISETQIDNKFCGITSGAELSYRHFFGNWHVGLVAGVFEYKMPVDKTTTASIGSSIIVTTYDDTISMVTWYGGITGGYAFNDHWSLDATARVGYSSDSKSIGKTIQTTTSGTTTTKREWEPISQQTGVMVFPSISMQYKF